MRKFLSQAAKLPFASSAGNNHGLYTSCVTVRIMKSFRLDRESVSKFIESWPMLAISAAICLGLAYVGWTNAFWRVLLVVYAGAYFGYVVRGRLFANLRERYPNARWIGLLSVGLSVMTLGVLSRMAFHAQGG